MPTILVVSNKILFDYVQYRDIFADAIISIVTQIITILLFLIKNYYFLNKKANIPKLI